MPDKELFVTTYAGYKGEERPKSFIIEGKTVEVLEIVERWVEEGRDYRRRRRFFEVKGSDGKDYRLYYDEAAEEWYLKDT